MQRQLAIKKKKRKEATITHTDGELVFLAHLLPPVPPNESLLLPHLCLPSLAPHPPALIGSPQLCFLPASPSVLQPRLPARVTPHIRSRLATSALSV